MCFSGSAAFSVGAANAAVAENLAAAVKNNVSLYVEMGVFKPQLGKKSRLDVLA